MNSAERVIRVVAADFEQRNAFASRARGVDAANLLVAGALVLLFIVSGVRSLSIVRELAASAAGVDLVHAHHDFLAFYSAAHYTLLGRVGDVYNPTALANYQHTLVPHNVGAAGYMPFLNPPFAAAFQAPLGLLAEPIARLVWFSVNTLLAVLIAVGITSSIPGKQRAVASVIILGTFPVYQALIEGQWSLILLLGCLAALHFARRKSYVVSGACLSVLWLKPQLALIVLLGLLLFRCWRITLGMVTAVVLVALLTLPITGVHAYVAYVPFLVNVFRDHLNGAGALHPAVWKGNLSLAQGFNGLFAGLFSQSSVVMVLVLSLLSMGVTLAVFLRAALKVRPGFDGVANELMLVASVTLVLLTDPHLFAQDITLVFLAVPILSRHLRNPFAMLLGLCLITDAPLLDQFLPLHLFTVCLWCLTMLICLAAIRGGLPADSQGTPAPGRMWDQGLLSRAWLARVFTPATRGDLGDGASSLSTMCNSVQL